MNIPLTCGSCRTACAGQPPRTIRADQLTPFIWMSKVRQKIERSCVAHYVPNAPGISQRCRHAAMTIHDTDCESRR
jgi:hypothetical protein